MMTQDEKQNFRAWLKINTNLSVKGSGDVVSRLTRVEKITPIHTKANADDFLFNLGKNLDFLSLSMDVRSQLKRAYKLYSQFKEGN
jgi:hypothetical protein